MEGSSEEESGEEEEEEEETGSEDESEDETEDEFEEDESLSKEEKEFLRAETRIKVLGLSCPSYFRKYKINLVSK